MIRALLFSMLLLLTVTSAAAYGQGTQFIYQGRLTDSGNPADGLFDMQFKLFDTQAVGTGIQHGGANKTVQVSDGVFTVQLDFGADAFDGSARYLLSLAYLAVFGSVIAFGAFLTLLGRIGADRAGYVAVAIPVVALLLSALFEGLRWHPALVAGMLLCIAGNVAVLRRA